MDDLVHLALALDVSPAALMMPATDDPTADLDLAPGAESWTKTQDWWSWLTAAHPLWEGPNTDPHDVETWRRSVSPPWAWKAATDG